MGADSRESWLLAWSLSHSFSVYSPGAGKVRCSTLSRLSPACSPWVQRVPVAGQRSQAAPANGAPVPDEGAVHRTVKSLLERQPSPPSTETFCGASGAVLSMRIVRDTDAGLPPASVAASV